MATTVNAFAAHSATEDLVPFKIERRAPRADDVSIEILYTGVCHSDLHSAKNDWGMTNYPIVPGHEIVGKVTAVGPSVSKFKVGDLVGVGCLVDSCRECKSCKKGLENYCSGNSRTGTYNSKDKYDGTTTFGGYSQAIVTSERFVLRMPASLDLKGAAPLLCAGITMYSPLKHWGAGPGKKVAIVGLGGLGHMGLKLAKALGAEVTLFTRSPGKEADAKAFGADRVVISTDAEQMKAVAGQFDLIIDTVPTAHDVNPYIPTLDYDGTLCIVGLVGGLEGLSTVPMIFGRRSVAGSLIGGLPETQEMLDFCGEKGIACEVEMIKMQEINEAYKRLHKADVRFRFVIDMASLKTE